MCPVESGLCGPCRVTNASSWPRANSPSNWKAGKIFKSAKASVNDEMYLRVEAPQWENLDHAVILLSYLRNSSTVWGIQTGRNQKRGWRMPTLTMIFHGKLARCLFFPLSAHDTCHSPKYPPILLQIQMRHCFRYSMGMTWCIREQIVLESKVCEA